MTDPQVHSSASISISSRVGQRLRDDPIASAVLAIFLLLQTYLAFVLNINWDEYYFLSQIHAFRAGDLTTPFQTFHVEILFWMAALPLSEPDQIVAGRLLMLLCEAGMLLCLYAIARRLFSARAAALVLVVYVTSGWVLGHGVSFRTDPLAAFMIMTSLGLLFLARRWFAMVAAGILAALGLLVTVKTGFYFPAFLAAFLWRAKKEGLRSALGLFAIAGLALVVAGAGLWSLHGMAMGAAVEPAPASGRAVGLYDRVIGSQAWFPRWPYIQVWMIWSMIPLLLVVTGLLGRWRRNRFRVWTGPAILMLLVAPILCLALYRNAFPYFFPFIFVPAVLAAGAADGLLSASIRNALLAGMAISLGGQTASLWGRDQDAQRLTAMVAHQLFPDPVPYIDRNGMLPSFPKVGFFMSTWGIEAALASGEPALKPVIETRHPPLVITNVDQLDAALGGPPPANGIHLHAGDLRALRDNYVHHWGALWVAGKRLNPGPVPASFDLVIPGIYTLECSGVVTIDDATAPCRSTVILAAGAHRIKAPRTTALTLRWGRQLARPSIPEPDKPIYHGF